jgi:hypothetical protein
MLGFIPGDTCLTPDQARQPGHRIPSLAMVTISINFISEAITRRPLTLFHLFVPVSPLKDHRVNGQ